MLLTHQEQRWAAAALRRYGSDVQLKTRVSRSGAPAKQSKSKVLTVSVYAGQEATVRTGHGTTDWFQIGKGVRQGCILSPCSFNFYAEYIMRNARLIEA